MDSSTEIRRYTVAEETKNVNESSNDLSLTHCETIHIHPSSDLFDPRRNYVGLINYSTGEIYIKESDWLLNYIALRRRSSTSRKDLHGRLFYWIYRRWRKPNTTFIGRGFSYLDSEWKYQSKTLNPIEHDYQLNKFEQALIQFILQNLYINHRWLEMPSHNRFDCKTLNAMQRNKQYISMAEPSNIYPNRKLHGTIKWLNNERRRLGIIECIGLDRDFCIHSTEIMNHKLYSGDNVEFNLLNDSRGWKATNIVAIWP